MMARARNIKPGFAKNEDLAECSIAARLCFALLPTLADREGRLEDRPKRIKGELFAYDSIEVEPLLAELFRYGFIERYVVDGLGVIQIMAFKKHQNPHHKEQKSVLPPHQSLRLSIDGKYEKPEAEQPLQPAKASEMPGLAPPRVDLARGSNRADSLIPDSLIPDSLIPDSGLPREKKQPAIFRGAGAPTFADPPPDTKACDVKCDEKGHIRNDEALEGKPDEAEPLVEALPPSVAPIVADAPAATRGTRLALGWALPNEWGQWALKEFPQWTPVKVRLEGQKFADHWQAKAGKAGISLDWLAVWRNWCRSDIAHRDDPRPNGRHGPPADSTFVRNAKAKRLLGFALTVEELAAIGSMPLPSFALALAPPPEKHDA